MNDTKNTIPDTAALESRKFATFPLSFRDPWDDKEVELNFHFAKPTKSQVKRLQDTAGKNPTQAARNLLLDTVHPDEKTAFESRMDDYPGIATSYSTALIKAVGISNDLGN